MPQDTGARPNKQISDTFCLRRQHSARHASEISRQHFAQQLNTALALMSRWMQAGSALPHSCRSPETYCRRSPRSSPSPCCTSADAPTRARGRAESPSSSLHCQRGETQCPSQPPHSHSASQGRDVVESSHSAQFQSNPCEGGWVPPCACSAIGACRVPPWYLRPLFAGIHRQSASHAWAHCWHFRSPSPSWAPLWLPPPTLAPCKASMPLFHRVRVSHCRESSHRLP